MAKSRIGVENEEINFFALSRKRGGRRVIAWRKPRDSAAFASLFRGVRHKMPTIAHIDGDENRYDIQRSKRGNMSKEWKNSSNLSLCYVWPVG